uniref:Uncharacterized protein n=1 Tax=Romanomermis culicivorax TaxID=13658 RepID=A0A915JU54_ROMCU
MLKGLLGGATAIPPLDNVGVGVTIPNKSQQEWPGLEPVDWQKHQSCGWNVVCYHPTYTQNIFISYKLCCKTPDSYLAVESSNIFNSSKNDRIVTLNLASFNKLFNDRLVFTNSWIKFLAKAFL